MTMGISCRIEERMRSLKKDKVFGKYHHCEDQIIEDYDRSNGREVCHEVGAKTFKKRGKKADAKRLV